LRYLFIFFVVIIVFTSCGESTTSSKPIIESPSDLVAILISSSEVQLIWTDNSDLETGFIIERKAAGGNYETIVQVIENVVSYIDSQLETNTEYSYRIAALTENDHSDWTYSNIVQTPIDIFAPSNLFVNNLSSSQVHLIWTDNTDIETGFLIHLPNLHLL